MSSVIGEPLIGDRRAAMAGCRRPYLWESANARLISLRWLTTNGPQDWICTSVGAAQQARRPTVTSGSANGNSSYQLTCTLTLDLRTSRCPRAF